MTTVGVPGPTGNSMSAPSNIPGAQPATSASGPAASAAPSTGAGGGAPGVGPSGSAGSTGAGGSTAPSASPATCAQAAADYKLENTMLDASLVPAPEASNWAAAGAALVRTIVAIDPASNRAYVGITKSDNGSFAAQIGAEGGTPSEVVTLPGAVLAGLSVTKDGLGVLLFDPQSVDQRTWAAVKRLGFDGKEKWNTELFHSPNLTDDMTKGNPTRGRLGYIASTDTLIAYFGHQMMVQMVRHQGGYLASIATGGQQTVLQGWFGSHNLDQQLAVDDPRAVVIGLGDAFPKGIFFSNYDKPKTNVIYKFSATGDGTANAQLGGVSVLSDNYAVFFVTNRSVSPDLTPGDWPNIDQTVAGQIRTAAAAGTDGGLLLVPKSATAIAAVTPVWVDLQVASGAHVVGLKSQRYGSGDMLLLGWGESTGGVRGGGTTNYFTQIVDKAGAVCQAKKAVDPVNAFDSDDMLRRADGAIVWANASGGRVHVVTLTP